MDELDSLKSRVARERKAREAAEGLLESKSREVYQANVELQALADRVAKREARLQSIFDSTLEAICVTDKQGNIASWNTSARRMFGYSREELEGMNIDVLIPGAMELDEADRQPFDEVEGVYRNGSRIPLERSVSRVEYGDTWDYTWVIRDISRRREAEAKLRKLQEKLIEASRQAGIADIASSVLHNVGNVLNSVSTSAELLQSRITGSRLGGLEKVTRLLQQHRGDLPVFLTESPQGKQLLDYLEKLAAQLVEEKAALTAESNSLQEGLEHIKDVVRAQQTYARRGGVEQSVSVGQMVTDVLAMNTLLLDGHKIQVVKALREQADEIQIDKHLLMQIFGNLVRNAIDSLIEAQAENAVITIQNEVSPEGGLYLSVEDNGMGIATENLTNIFNQGFTTKTTGHGFGLHSSALAAKNLGGNLTVESAGPGAGARFTLQLPASVLQVASSALG